MGALVGPTQVVARAIDMAISRYHHPLWTMLAATLFVAIGVGSLWVRFRIISATLVFYGAGIGIESIARATVPLAIFGHDRYAVIMGRIASPSLIAQAAAPSLGAILMQRYGVGVTLGTLFAASAVNVAAVITLRAHTATDNALIPMIRVAATIGFASPRWAKQRSENQVARGRL